VATWNLQNYLLQNRYEEGKFRPDYPMPEQRKRRIRTLLLEVRPDILFLQELGSKAFLSELQLDLAASGLNYPFAAFSSPKGARSGLAVLAMSQPESLIYYDRLLVDESGTAMRRGVQEVLFSFGDTRFRFFHVHLKSRYSSDPSDPESSLLRAAEIAALLQFLNRQESAHQDEALAIVGDFNTPFHAPLLQSLQAGWAPLDGLDSHGQNWTYQHRKTGSRERLDGFWFPRSCPLRLLHADLLPLDSSPSDHRLVLSSLIIRKNTCPSPLVGN
jgi:endonuclease/exonuclease/phosphatase family metal-dependent hydrolase